MKAVLILKHATENQRMQTCMRPKGFDILTDCHATTSGNFLARSASLGHGLPIASRDEELLWEGSTFQERKRHMNLRRFLRTQAGCPSDTQQDKQRSGDRCPNTWQDKQGSGGRCPRDFLSCAVEKLTDAVEKLTEKGIFAGTPDGCARAVQGGSLKFDVILSFVPFLLPNFGARPC